MLRSFLSLLALSVLLSCNDSNTQGTTQNKDTTQPKDTAKPTGTMTRSTQTPPKATPMDTADALKRIRHLNQTSRYDTVFTAFNVADLKDIFCTDADDISSARFILALLDTTVIENGHQRHYKVPEVILQIGRTALTSSSTSPPPTPVYTYYRGSGICPPPQGSCLIQ